MIEKGYDRESAQKCVDDVLDARRIARENAMKSYIGKRVKADFDGLLFDVLVHDVKVDHSGQTQIQVKPLNGGQKMVWIKKFSL